MCIKIQGDKNISIHGYKETKILNDTRILKDTWTQGYEYTSI